MTGVFVIMGGVVAVVLGISALAVPSETSDSFKDTARTVGLPTGLYNPRVVRFTAVLFIAAGVVLALIGWSMTTSGR
jgi:heme A synthase